MEDSNAISYLESRKNFFGTIEKREIAALTEMVIEALKASYQNRKDPFHYSHDVVDDLRDEFKRRGKEDLFYEAFNEFDENVSLDPEDKV